MKRKTYAPDFLSADDLVSLMPKTEVSIRQLNFDEYEQQIKEFMMLQAKKGHHSCEYHLYQSMGRAWIPEEELMEEMIRRLTFQTSIQVRRHPTKKRTLEISWLTKRR
jgi:hypothetical protein